jgi:hypothetical protein
MAEINRLHPGDPSPFTIEDAAEDGYHLILEDGVVIARSRSRRVCKRIVGALLAENAGIDDNDADRLAMAMRAAGFVDDDPEDEDATTVAEDASHILRHLRGPLPPLLLSLLIAFVEAHDAREAGDDSDAAQDREDAAIYALADATRPLVASMARSCAGGEP